MILNIDTQLHTKTQLLQPSLRLAL